MARQLAAALVAAGTGIGVYAMSQDQEAAQEQRWFATETAEREP